MGEGAGATTHHSQVVAAAAGSPLEVVDGDAAVVVATAKGARPADHLVAAKESTRLT